VLSSEEEFSLSSCKGKDPLRQIAGKDPLRPIAGKGPSEMDCRKRPSEMECLEIRQSTVEVKGDIMAIHSS
jgi:hypothetical protein